jgi:uncharacterized membrane protein
VKSNITLEAGIKDSEFRIKNPEFRIKNPEVRIHFQIYIQYHILFFKIGIDMQEKMVYKYFSDDDFLRISKKIREMEKITSGEIRVSLKESKPKFSKKSTQQLAEDQFYRLKMHETRDKTGIIIYLLLKDHKFYILADSGINEKVEQHTWDKVRDEMQSSFKNGDFGKGVLLGIEKVGNILAEHFPIKDDDTNELSNKVVL